MRNPFVGHPCDASRQKGPLHASQNSTTPSQLTEKEELKASRLTTPHTRTDAFTGQHPPPAPRSLAPEIGFVPPIPCLVVYPGAPPTPACQSAGKVEVSI